MPAMINQKGGYKISGIIRIKLVNLVPSFQIRREEKLGLWFENSWLIGSKLLLVCILYISKIIIQTHEN